MISLPILNPEVYVTHRMERWLRCKATIRRLVRSELFYEDPHCAYCRKPLASPDAGVLDHATPKSRGGGEGPSNAILACKACDYAKGNRTISEWRADLLAGLFKIGNKKGAEP